VLWAGGAPEFKNQTQANPIMETILGRYYEILSTLQTAIVEDWAMGFLEGIQVLDDAPDLIR
jgi:hypothetical protein